VVIGRVGHPLAQVANPTLDELARYPWIVGRATTPLRLHWETMFARHSQPMAPIECGSVLLIRGVLRDTDFLTLLSPAQIALEVEAGILVLIGPPVNDSVRNIGITTRAGWRPTALQARFLELIAEAAESTAMSKNEYDRAQSEWPLDATHG